MPTLTVIAGPNGSAKSTLTSFIWFEGNANLIDPDAIARRSPLFKRDWGILCLEWGAAVA
jgi:predicted ABC-type ATPase